MSEDHDPRIDRLEENVREVKAILKDLGSQISHIEQKLATTRTDEKLASAAEVTVTRAEIEKLRQDVADKPDKSWLPTVAGLVLLAYAIGGIWASFVAVFLLGAGFFGSLAAEGEAPQRAKSSQKRI